MNLAIITAHAGSDSLQDAFQSWYGNMEGVTVLCRSYPEFVPPLYVMDGSGGMLPAYEKGWREAASDGADLIAHWHDDLILKDPQWLPRVMAEFEAPDVGVVGFCGALVHGSPDMYKTRYDHRQLGRSYVLSNTVDAEVHGTRFAGSNDVAVLDGFALIVRRELLEKAGGWPLDSPIGYLAYDYWLCCIAHRLGYRVRVVGVACHHLGGRTAVNLKLNTDDTGEKYDAAHRFIYNEFRDVLPWSCV